ncbi:MAG: DUF4252 domain-containing protein [Bryobacteraceae bacterium]
MKLTVAGLLAALTIAPIAMGQKLELKLDAVAAKASAKNEVDLDGAVLKMALGKVAQIAGDDASKNAKLTTLQKALAGLEAVHVRNYEFAAPGAYSDKDLEPLRQQLGKDSGWSRIVNVQEKNESTEVFTLTHGDEVDGCLIVSAEPKELTVVHIAGAITTADMKELVNSNVKYDLSSLLGQGAK